MKKFHSLKFSNYWLIFLFFFVTNFFFFFKFLVKTFLSIFYIIKCPFLWFFELSCWVKFFAALNNFITVEKLHPQIERESLVYVMAAGGIYTPNNTLPFPNEGRLTKILDKHCNWEYFFIPFKSGWNLMDRFIVLWIDDCGQRLSSTYYFKLQFSMGNNLLEHKEIILFKVFWFSYWSNDN